MDLSDLLTRGEGKTLEFKGDLSSPTPAMRTLVAFANTSGGILLIGVDDATRHVRGVADPLALEERLANLISDSIEPRLLTEIETLSWRRTHLVGVEVYPSPSRPISRSPRLAGRHLCAGRLDKPTRRRRAHR